MLVKNCQEPFEASDDASIRASTTPHRIKIPSTDEDISNANKRHIETQKKTTADSNFNAIQPPDKFTKTLIKRGRKPLPRSIINQKTAHNNHKINEYFQVRRSVRKCKKAVLEEIQKDLEKKVLCGIEDGLQVKHFVDKGRGVVTTKAFVKGEFVVEYIGDLIDQITAKKREAKYAKDQNTGCYMYYFQHRNQQYCIDATAESNKLGRLVNHSRNGNLITRIVEIGSAPHLVLIAKEDIPVGTEVSYDYGDRSRESIRNHPWLAL